MQEIFSNAVGSSCELTLLVDVKKGFVPHPQATSYATRLRRHLQMLDTIYQRSIEATRDVDLPGPIEMLRTLKAVNWTLLNDDTQMLFAVSFDRPLEPYMRLIVDVAGPLLDTILCNCDGFDGHSSDFGFDKFMEFGRRNQIPVEMFVASNPNVSIDDSTYYVELDAALRRSKDPAAFAKDYPAFRMILPEERAQQAFAKEPLKALNQQLELLRLLAENSLAFETSPPGAPEPEDRTFARTLYGNFAHLMVPLEKMLRAVLGMAGLGNTVARLDGLRAVVGFIRDPKNAQSLAPVAPMLPLLERFTDTVDWLVAHPEKRSRKVPVAVPETGEIQAGLLAPDSPVTSVAFSTEPWKPTHAALAMFRVDVAKAGRAFLQKMTPLIWPDKSDAHRYKLSVTNEGLRALGVSDGARVQTFPEAFREGMEARAGLLGDTQCNHPQEWDWPVANWPNTEERDRRIHPAQIDLLVLVETQAPDADRFPRFDAGHPLFEPVEALSQRIPGVSLIAVEEMHRNLSPGQYPPKGHLGFADGVSQPNYQEDGPDGERLGDLLLGHEETLEGGKVHKQVAKVLRNGTFQVIRKTRIDVERFGTDASGAEVAPQVQAKMMGRSQDGDFLPGSFPGDAADPEGAGTPLQSHIRLANPRDGRPVPRILRRGFSYGPPYADNKGSERGLFFIAYNANISEQFALIQRCLSGSHRPGISSGHGDPLLAPARPPMGRHFHYLDGKAARSVELSDTPAAQLEWGLYAFVPSREGMEALIAGIEAPAPGLPGPVQALVHPSDGPPEAEDWRRILEDGSRANIPNKEALWHVVRQQPGGRLDTAFGDLAGSREAVTEIFENKSNAYSVGPYQDRMAHTVGPLYLSRDEPRGSKAAQDHDDKPALEDFLAGKDLPAMTQGAYDVARGILDAIVPEDDGTVRITARRFIYDVLTDLSHIWLGLPLDNLLTRGKLGRTPLYPEHLLVSSAYVFAPYPSRDNVDGVAKHLTGALKAQIAADIASKVGPRTGSFYAFLRNRASQSGMGDYWTDEKITELVLGGCFGFVGPTAGSFIRVFALWVGSGTFWRVQAASQGGQDLDVIRRALINTMFRTPTPDLLPRFRNNEDGSKDVVTLSIRSAVADGREPGDEDLLFGGTYTKGKADNRAHPCPGKDMAIAALIGALKAILETPNMTSEGPLTLLAPPPGAAQASVDV